MTMRHRTENISFGNFVAYIERNGDVATVNIYRRKEDGFNIDFAKNYGGYETLSRGAVASARRSILQLEAGR